MPPQPHWLRTITIFLVGQTLSLFGSSVVGYAVIWYITLKTGSGWQYALMFIASNLATALTTIPGGVWADRYPRKYLIVGADIFVAIFTLVLAIVMLSGYERLWLIIVVLCLRGLASGIQTPAVTATIPQLVPTNKLLRVNSINSSIQALTYIAAPALSAVLLVYLKLGWILLVDVVTAAIGVGCVLAIAIPRLDTVLDAPEGVRGYFTHIGQAVRFVSNIPALRRMALLTIVLMIIVFPPAQMTPVLVVRRFGPEQWKLATAEIVWSTGMIVGGLLLAWWGGMRNRMTLILIIAASWGALTIGFGLAPNIWFFCVVMAIYGLSLPGVNTAVLTSIQELVPDKLLGRTMGLLNLILSLTIPIGLGIVGPLADIVDIRVLTVICGAAGLLFIGGVSLDRGPASQLYAPE